MKKLIIFLFVTSFISSLSMAQGVRYGIIGGYNLSSPSDFKSQSGFHVGIKGEIPLHKVDGLYVDMALMLNNCNLKSQSYYYIDYNSTATSSDYGSGSTWKYKLYYLNVPVHIGYRFKISDNVRMFVNAGPYINIGMAGKLNKTTMSSDGSIGEDEVSKNTFSDKITERVDYGLGLRAGAELCKHLQLSVGYDLGLNNIVKNGVGSKGRTLTASCAYVF